MLYARRPLPYARRALTLKLVEGEQDDSRNLCLYV